MTNTATIPRLFMDMPMSEGARLDCTSQQAHYLAGVLRKAVGDEIKVFNGRDGEWSARINSAKRGRCALITEQQTRRQTPEPDLWLIFAPLKKTATDFIATKGTELGVAAFKPMMSGRTVASRFNAARFRANAIEAAEQTERLSIPTVDEAIEFSGLFDNWPAGRSLLYADETGNSPPIADVLAEGRGGPDAIMVGPEGGFLPAELDHLAKLSFAVGVGLGPRILRADTAAIAAVSCWQALCGDWQQPTSPR